MKSYDIGIIGAGMIGAITAHHLASIWPEKKIVLIEGTEPPLRNSTSYSIGLNVPFFNSTEKKEFIINSHKFPLTKQFDTKIKSIIVTRLSAQELSKTYYGAFKPIQSVNFFYERFGKKIFNEKIFKFYETENHYTNALELRNFIIDDLKNFKGIDYIQNFPVNSIKNYGQKKLLQSFKGQILSEIVIHATGPWNKLKENLFDKTKYNLGRVKKVCAFLIDHPVEDDDRLLFMLDKDWFLLPVKQKNWVLSICSNDWKSSPELEIEPKVNSKELAMANNILNILGKDWIGKIFAQQVFYDHYDNVPSVSRIGKHILAQGASGSGIRLAPGYAVALQKTIEELYNELT